MLVFQPSDGTQKTLGYSIINDYSELLIRRCFIGTDDFTIIYEKNNGEIGELKTKAVKEYLPDKFKYFQPKSNPLISEKFIELFRLSSNTIYLRIKSMDYNNYKKINKEIFQKTISNGVKNLVIDLRDNGGGTPKSSFDFLSYILFDTLSQTDYKPKGGVSHYLSSKLKLLGVWFWAQITPHHKTELGTKYITNVTYPKNKQYKGNIYILINGYTASSACTLAAYLKHRADAICIGQETAGGETGCNANSFQTLTLPNSKIEISFPLFRFNNDISIPDNHHGIRPKYKIKYSPKLYLLNKDLEMEKVFELIN